VAQTEANSVDRSPEYQSFITILSSDVNLSVQNLEDDHPQNVVSARALSALVFLPNVLMG
jgi:hypothetical protein